MISLFTHFGDGSTLRPHWAKRRNGASYGRFTEANRHETCAENFFAPQALLATKVNEPTHIVIENHRK